MEEIFQGVYRKGRSILTKNLSPGNTVYGERIFIIDGKEYREWDPFRSKLCGAIMKGLKKMPIGKRSKVLYLGAATGTTPSHISDIASEGEVYAIEFSGIAMRKLIGVCEKRPNLIPIMADARKTSEYSDVGQVDVIYQDVAQRDQVEILAKNAKAFLKKGGYAMLALKTKSINTAKGAREIAKEEEAKMAGLFRIEERIDLEPYDKEHFFYVLKYAPSP
ncbi:MAG: fibrillarin-like rRNA/tRNA 2'-O-methyltransferase [Candidatus Anstonellales archaeon]